MYMPNPTSSAPFPALRSILIEAAGKTNSPDLNDVFTLTVAKSGEDESWLDEARIGGQRGLEALTSGLLVATLERLTGLP